MIEDNSFAELMGRLRRGDEDAAALIFRRFGERLIALAGSRLGPQFRPKLDPEDVVQSAFRSFFVRQAGGQFDPHSWDNLWSLLTMITLRKCGHQVRQFRTAVRDVRREVAPQENPDDSNASWETIAREPTPAEAALLTEVVEDLLHGLEPRDRRIVELALQGCQVPEISTEVGLTERTVYRTLERVKSKLERRNAAFQDEH